MADTKITALTALTAADPINDVIPIVDVSDTTMAASGTTKKISVNNILGASGTATLASATITGDLTVDTSTLKVDSTNNRVGIGTASPAAALDVQGSSLRLQLQSSSNGAYSTWKYIGKNSSGTAVNFEQGLNIAADNAFELYDNQNTQLVSRYISGVSGYHSWFLGGITGLTLNSTANLVLKGGTAAANGVGVTFPATQVASSDANCLDDYEEGTFVPTVVGTTAAGTGTYSTNTGRYTKVGNLVTFQVFIDWTAHTGTGNMKISNLPFTNGAGLWACNVGYSNGIALTAGNILTAYVDANLSQINLSQYPTGGGTATLIPLDTAGAIVLSASYSV